MVRKNSLKAWFLAARPKTLVASSTPVVVASALAFHDGKFHWPVALICLVFAVLAQVIANFANDYFDFIKGCDNQDRLGPERAVVEGWVTPKTMLYVTLGLCVVNSLVGLMLLFYGGWYLIFVGIAVIFFALAYTGGPYPLAYHGWGDVCVFIFFGIIPVGFTYYLQAGHWSPASLVCGISVGLVVINILVANNYRDRFTDAQVGKRTTVVIFGERFGSYFYLLNGIIAVLCCQYFWFHNSVAAPLLPLIYLVFHLIIWRKMVAIGTGRGLVGILEQTAKNVIVFGATLSVGLMIR